MSENTLYRKLAEVMGEVGMVPKRGRNDFHNYDYVTEADLIEAVRSKLAEKKIMILPSLVDIDEREVTTDRGKTSTVSTATVSFKLVDSESGEFDTCVIAGQGDDGGDKGLYKAYTGALKYFLMKTFLIPTGDDPEADTRTDERASERKASPPRTSGKPPSEKQAKLLKDLLSQKSVTVPQLEQMLVAVGASTEIEPGWVEKLTGGKDGQVSALIDRLMSGDIPPATSSPIPPSDVPTDGVEDFEHPKEAQTLEELALEQGEAA